MNVRKPMTISQAKNEKAKLENELDLYLEKKQINFEKTQPQASKFKEIITSGGFVKDKFLHYVIKDKDLDKLIYPLQKEILALENYIVNEMERISHNKGNEYIVYLRDEEKLSWNRISRKTDYSLSQCHRLYNKAKENNLQMSDNMINFSKGDICEKNNI